MGLFYILYSLRSWVISAATMLTYLYDKFNIHFDDQVTDQ